MQLPRVVISAPQRSSGKTTLSIGLCSALTRAGLKVQPFKKGPDYIDPMWLSTATGRDCHNLDFFMMGEEVIARSFQRMASDADISVIEGNMGLYDGIELDGKGSTSDLARLLEAPIILIVDTSNMTRSIAPLVIGLQKFESGISMPGMILNKVSSERHESKLRAAIDRYCDIEVVGAIPKLPEIGIIQRHLGLRPAKEDTRAVSIIESIGDAIKNYIDLDRLIRIAKSSPSLPKVKEGELKRSESNIKLGVARDRAFTFYYPENMEALQVAGAELVSFSPMWDGRLPKVNGLYIGGGFPEVFMRELEDNRGLREEIKVAINRGMPVYAECGGLMYLARGISWNGKTREMVGGIPCGIVMHEKPKGHGYIKLQATGRSWFNTDSEIRGHEFHYSEVVDLGIVDFAYKLLRGRGIDGKHDGIVYKNVLASYAHLHSLGTPQWAERFVAFVKDIGFSL
ncbi:MAG: hydrogenobyrinic acid a,c-diamide synthase (glutamine-hydrolyzing) [Actinobacteria bacterium]|nr:hydrogenobyrinic acid a,c-diamide synthase (glutamine-hydrolyzing) [Actinomycetota bacterium]